MKEISLGAVHLGSQNTIFVSEEFGVGDDGSGKFSVFAPAVYNDRHFLVREGEVFALFGEGYSLRLSNDDGKEGVFIKAEELKPKQIYCGYNKLKDEDFIVSCEFGMFGALEGFSLALLRKGFQKINFSRPLTVRVIDEYIVPKEMTALFAFGSTPEEVKV